MAIQKKISGLIFPVKLLDGHHVFTQDLDLIKASIKIILSWPLKTRFFNGDFGSRIYEVIEEPNDDILITIVRRFIIDSISRWEQRIELVSMDILRPEVSKLTVNLVYRIKDLDIQDSLFYTYYIN
jgi:phage baseplate assembly protein W